MQNARRRKAINPFAAAIAVFRLTVAAPAIWTTPPESAPGFGIHVLAGDSLWFSHDQEGLFDHKDDFAYPPSTRRSSSTPSAGAGTTPWSRTPVHHRRRQGLNAGYRERYNYLKAHQLTAPS